MSEGEPSSAARRPGEEEDPAATPEVPNPPRMVQKLLDRRARHKERHLVIRAVWVFLGFFLIIGGLVIGIFPGPGPVLLVPLGLAMLALEFVWAERLLERALIYFERAREGASSLSGPMKVAVGVMAATIGLVVIYGGAAWFYELPAPLPDPLSG